MRFPAAAALWLLRLAASTPVPASGAGTPSVCKPREAFVAQDGTQVAYEAIVVGGGFSGMSAASGLGRVCRSTLVIDSGEPRNNSTRHVHDVPGFDGKTPAHARWVFRKQLAAYESISMRNGTVIRAEPMQNHTYFRVTYHSRDGTTTTTTARILVLATGLVDVLPDTPGLRGIWGQGGFWCLWCDGYEHANQTLGILAPLNKVPDLVREALTLYTDIVALVNGTDTPATRAAMEDKDKNPQWQAYLALHGVPVENGTVVAIERLANGTTGHEDPSLPTVPEHDRFRVEFADGTSTEANALLMSPPARQKSDLWKDLNVTLVNGRLLVDTAKGMATNAPGVFAVGDANADNVSNVLHAFYTGKKAAVYAHGRLGRQSAAAKLASGKPGANALDKRSADEEARAVWNLVNGRPGDLFYAGEFDQ